jgi:hypothetical protein
MPITEEIVAAFLKCETKAYLQYGGTLGAQSEFSQRAQNQREEYRESCRKLLCAALHAPSFLGTPDLQSLKDRRYHLVLDYAVAESEINVRLDALVLSRVKRARLDCPYIPVRFVPSKKLSTDDKLMLAFDAVAFSKVHGKTPRAGRIIHGCNHTMAPARRLLRSRSVFRMDESAVVRLLHAGFLPLAKRSAVAAHGTAQHLA